MSCCFNCDHPLVVLNRPKCAPDRSPLLGLRKNRFRGNVSSETSLDIYAPNENICPTNQTYFSRFWILGFACFIMFFHCVEWNTWGPIIESVQAVYGWSTGTLALFAGWVTIVYVISVGPVCWMAHNWGLRFSMIFSAVITTVGMGVRCIPLPNKWFTLMCHFGSILLGVGSTVVLAVPPMIASDWFAPHERTSAIAIMMSVSQLGSIASYLEPLLVRRPGPHVTNEEIEYDVKLLLYIGAGVSAGILVLLLLYFPSKPPTPPSIASSAPRMNFNSSIRAIVSNRNVWILILAYGIAVGPSLAWITTLDVSLLPLGIKQDEAMWVGISAVSSAAIFSIIAAKVTDLVFGYLKLSILVLLLCASGCFFWFYLICQGIIPLCKWQIYVSTSSALALNFATITLFVELATEVAHPVPEVVIGGIITASDNLCSSVFLLIYLIPNIGVNWVIYTLIGSNAAVVIPILFVKESYQRSKMDRPHLT